MEQQVEKTYATKITRLDTKGKILDFSDLMDIKKREDTLKEGKIVLNFTEYDTTTTKSKGRTSHYLDVAKARVLFDDIVNYRFDDHAFVLIEDYGGGSGAAAGHDDWTWCWRHLQVTSQSKDSNGEPLKIGQTLRFAFETCEGEKGANGQFSPKSGATKDRFFIQVPVTNARIASASVLAYMQAKLSSWVAYTTSWD